MANGTYMLPAFGDGSSYVKLADGTLIQWGFYQYPQGSIVNVTHKDQVITYPVEFHSSTGMPLVSVSNVGSGMGTGSQPNVCIPLAGNLNASTKLTSFTLRAWKQASVGTDNDPEPLVSWIAIGRWK